MKLISWNVNGLRACVTKGFVDYFNEVQADIFCIQESKLQEGQINLEIGEEYEQYWNYAQKRATRELPSLHELSPYRYVMGLKRIMSLRVGLSRWSLTISI